MLLLLLLLLPFTDISVQHSLRAVSVLASKPEVSLSALYCTSSIASRLCHKSGFFCMAQQPQSFPRRSLEQFKVAGICRELHVQKNVTGAVSLLRQDGTGQLWLGGSLKFPFLAFVCIEIAEKGDAVCTCTCRSVCVSHVFCRWPFCLMQQGMSHL